jgi:hypothetical protein
MNDCNRCVVFLPLRLASIEMGIRFHCPSGHKLNVKAFLAGKKAVCPKCGEKVLVPFESDPALTQSGQRNSEPAAQVAAPSTPAQPPALVPSNPSPPEPSTSAPLPAAGDDAWYVRPPAGGQYGPAEPDVMQVWLAEGRVPAASMVWRVGWPEWRAAIEVFPQLASTPPSTTVVLPPPSLPPAIAPSVAAVPTVAPVAPAIGKETPQTAADLGTLIGISPESPSVRVQPTTVRRRRNNSNTLVISGILAVLVVILLIVLGIVLSRQSNAPAPPVKPSPVAEGKADVSAANDLEDAPPATEVDQTAN